MSDPGAQLRLVVEVDPAVEPIGGHVADGPDRTPFRGWLQLLSAIDALRRGRPSSPPTEGDQQ